MFSIFHRRIGNQPVLPASQASEPEGDPAQPVRTEVARHLPLMKVLSTQIAGTAQQIEQSVVGVCSNFQQIADQARKSVGRAAAFLSNRDRHTSQRPGVDELIAQSRATFDSLLETLVKSVEISNQAVRHMKEIDAYAEKIAGALKLLENIADGNRILALNARIEAAHAGQFGKGFEIVATEVVAQTERSQSVISDVSRTIQELRSSASSALANLAQMSDQGTQSAENERREVEQTLQSFNDLDQEMRTMLEQASQDGARLSEEIGRAVHGMQFQDRVNQRLDHVIHALDASRGRLEGICEDVAEPDMSFMNEILSRYTMHEEREAADSHEAESGGGDVELF